MGIVVLIIIFLLLVIGYQDFSDRLVHWFYFPLVAILLLAQLLRFGQPGDHLLIVGLNMGIMVFMLIMTTFIYSVWKGELIFILDKALGSADILALGLVCITFSTINMVLFMLISFFCSSLFQLMALPFSKKAIHIPLAGIVSVLLVVALVLQDGFMLIDMTNDFHILGVIGGLYYF